jgi:transcriptional regulator with XRE-family HTH domain
MDTSSVIDELRAWRERNGLSQRQAAEVLVAGGVPVVLSTLARWEIGYRRPGRLAAALLKEFLKRHAKVKGVVERRYRKAAPTVSAAVVARVRDLRASGKTLREIGRQVGISESAVSRICAGSRRAIQAAHGSART